MAEKAAFFDCLDDHQTGFFCAHEYDENIENQLMDVLNPTQMKLYYQYEKSKTTHGDGIISQANEEISVADYNFENQLLDKFKREKNFVWLDIWGKSQMDSEMDNFDNWRENAMEDYFLSNLSGRERGKFVTLISDVKENDFIKTRNTTNQSIYSQWKNKKISQTPPFISDLNLPAKKQNLFLKIAAKKDFEALDSCMESYPEFREMYGWWRSAIRNNTVLSPPIGNTSIEVNSPIENMTIQEKSEDVSTDKILLEQSPLRKNKKLQTDLVCDRFTRDLYVCNKKVELLQEEKKRNTQEVKLTERLKTLASKVTSALKKETNILMLGETGTGKSTMINSMANYFKYDSFKAASEDKLVTLVPTRFQLFDYENKEHDIHVTPNVTTKSAANQNAEYTTSPKIFSFTYKNRHEKEQTIRVMDTPGLGDPKGMDYDKQTFERILNAIDEFEELHDICILMKPNEYTVYPGFRHCIQLILSQLHVSAVQNIFFCFTFSNTTNYRLGQTVPTLGAVFTKMELEGDLSHLEKSRVFCFDNEAVNFLMAKEKGLVFQQGKDQRLAEIYSKSSFEIFRMLLETSCREHHDPKDTIHFNATKKLLARITKPFVEFTRNHLLNETLIKDPIKQVTKPVEIVQFLINSFCEFSLFSSRNSITQYSDVFMIYINQDIAEEELKHGLLTVSQAQEDPLLKVCKVLKAEYQNRFGQMNKNNVKELSVGEINLLIRNMWKIEGWEALVEEILTFKDEMRTQTRDDDIETLFLEMLDDNQLVVYLTHAGKPTCADAMAGILTFRQYKVYEAVQKEIETEEFPKFFDEMNLSDSQRSSICTLIENKNFDLVDLFMNVYPDYSTEYQDWKNKIISSGLPSPKLRMHREPSNADSFSSLRVQATRRDTSSTITTVLNSPESEDLIDFKHFGHSLEDSKTTDADDTVSEGSDMTEVPEHSFPEPLMTSDLKTGNLPDNFVGVNCDVAPKEDPLFVHPRVLSAVNSVRQQLDELTNQARRMLRFLENTQELAKLSGTDIDLFDMNTQLPCELESQISVSDIIKDCHFCTVDHPSDYCKKYPTLDERLDLLSQNSCMRCLKECGKTCDDVFCVYCDSSEHHVALCPCYEHRQFLKTLLGDGEGSGSSGSLSILRF